MTSSGSPAPKKHCHSVTIGTHDGTFHCDEALACYMLKQLPEYCEADVVRSRKPEALSVCDIVVDVGGVYDSSSHRYDHHQRSFSGSMSSLTGGKKRWQTKLSSAGLVFLHFGHRVLSTVAGIEQDSPVLENLYDYVYSNFLEEIDAVDNGISDRDGEPRYKVTSTIGRRVSSLNPSWNQPASDRDRDLKFGEAMQLVGGEFRECVQYFQRSWLPAQEIVEKAVASRLEVHASGEVIRLEPSCPWKEHLFSAEETLSLSPPIKYILYQDTGGTWRVQAVPKHPTSFESRLPLPESWRGLRDRELDSVSGVTGCVFVHSSGFIGGNASFQGALKMATTALQLAQQQDTH